MYIGLLTGIVVGFVIGFFGAGSAVVGLPILLLLSGLTGHTALGTNISGVSMIALLILIYRSYRKDIFYTEAAVFTLPGLIGNYAGIQLGLVFPGKKLLFLLGFVLFFIAAWMIYLSKTKTGRAEDTDAHLEKTHYTKRLFYIGLSALVIGGTAGFFAISGGFMIVPALILAGGLNITEAAGTAIIPIVAFTGLAGFEYFNTGAVDTAIAFSMVPPGIATGIAGIWLAKHLPKTLMQRLFAVFLILIGIYMICR